MLHERFRRRKHVQVAGELIDDRWRKRIGQFPHVAVVPC